MAAYNYIDETGKEIGTWRVLSRGEDRRMRPAFVCLCNACGHEHLIGGDDLRRSTPRCPACVAQERKTRACACGSTELSVRSWKCGCSEPSRCPNRRPSRCPNRQPAKCRLVCNPCWLGERKALETDRESRPPVEQERSPTLCAKPIVNWLRPYLGQYDYESLALKCGINPQGLSRIMGGTSKRAKLDTVDKILCGMDAPGALRELYPEIYEFTPKQMQEAEEWAHMEEAA